MDDKHKVMSYRQDLPGFGEPMEGMWDGFQRINTDTKSGGIIGVFKHGATETRRDVVVYYLHPGKIYTVRESISGNMVKQATGAELAVNGFPVTIKEQYGGQLFEISSE